MDNFSKGRPVFQNYEYANQEYQQPATQTAYAQANTANTIDATASFGQDIGYGNAEMGREQYQPQDYQNEEGQVSLSDYNSHEIWIKVSTKK
jgi:hypothetical protein